jgi:SAM-dependent methyltransferase
MITTLPSPTNEFTGDPLESAAQVTLADGEAVSLAGMTFSELQKLQWQQEQAFARSIMQCPKGSLERGQTIRQAYDSICTILAAQAADADQPLVMGLHPKQVRLVLKLLGQQFAAGHAQPRVFEIGYGSGKLLAEVHGHGYAIGGIEVSSVMRGQAIDLLGKRHAASLLLGNLRDLELKSLCGRPTLVYWNDVLEHIPPDEASDYVRHIYDLLVPGGILVTITPNWLLRPSDVTFDFCPLRTEARGLHLKEYRLAEVARLLRRSGFARVATPLLATHEQLFMCGSGGRNIKQWIEPWIDRLPVGTARLLCRGLAMSVTIARK